MPLSLEDTCGIIICTKERGVYIVQKATGVVNLYCTVTEAVLRIGQDAMPLGTRDGYIEQAAFFLYPAF